MLNVEISCFTLGMYKNILRIAHSAVQPVKTRKSEGKPNAARFVRGRILRVNSEKSSGSMNCFSFLTGLGIKAKSTSVRPPF